MEIRITGNPNEIADLVKEIQSRQREIAKNINGIPEDSRGVAKEGESTLKP